MSGSYQQLLQKYNQLLALVLNNSGTQNLNSVLGFGNTTTNSAIFTELLNTITINGSALTYETGPYLTYVGDIVSVGLADDSIVTRISDTNIALVDGVSNDNCDIRKNKIEITNVPGSGIVRAIVLDNVTDSVPFIRVTTVDTATNNTNTILKNAIFEIVYESVNKLLLASNVSIGFTER